MSAYVANATLPSGCLNPQQSYYKNILPVLSSQFSCCGRSCGLASIAGLLDRLYRNSVKRQYPTSLMATVYASYEALWLDNSFRAVMDLSQLWLR